MLNDKEQGLLDYGVAAMEDANISELLQSINDWLNWSTLSSVSKHGRTVGRMNWSRVVVLINEKNCIVLV